MMTRPVPRDCGTKGLKSALCSESACRMQAPVETARCVKIARTDQTFLVRQRHGRTAVDGRQRGL